MHILTPRGAAAAVPRLPPAFPTETPDLQLTVACSPRQPRPSFHEQRLKSSKPSPPQEKCRSEPRRVHVGRPEKMSPLF